MFCVLFLFFKQKTAYEVRISDCSADVCSADLDLARALVAPDLSTGLRIDLQDARAAAGAELAEIVEQQDVAVGQDVRVVLAGPVAAARPDERLPVEIEIGRASCRESVCQYG